ncbi:MAG: RNA polymerase sigma-70 factor (ECF subfamily) [Myxococcota bacterium]|jgi:RNA polymerase sigma-70 factor (ECF subfamily)
MTSDSDVDLIKRCQNSTGAEFDEAYRQIFALYQDRVYNTCFRVTGNANDALDAAQETMVIIARRISSFAFRSKFSSWVYRIAINSAIDIRRKRIDAPRSGISTVVGVADGAEMMQQAADESPNIEPHQQLVANENQQLIQSALTDMNPKFAAILVLRYIEGLSYDEISEAQDCSLGTVKSRLNRAHQSLREFLESRGFDSTLLT